MDPTMADLSDPAFLQHVREQFPEGPVQPDGQDFDWDAPTPTNKERADQYRLAQMKKLFRMWRRWKCAAN